MIQTNWCVITGTPCSGKKTVVKGLEQHGFGWIPEVARTYIEAELSNGRTISEIRRDEAAFQRGLIETKARIESELDPLQTVFLVRAMPDSMTYYRVAGLDPAEVAELSKKFRYHRVFVFDRLKFESDGARTETEETLQFLDRQLEIDYRQLGYDVIRIPVTTVDKRVQLVLDSI